jgi:hypothetical protein
MLDDYYAVSELSGAINRTRDLLWPVRWGVWLRIAVIALFIGGGGGFNFPGSYSTGEFPADGGFSGMGLSDPGVYLALILLIAGIIILLAILWGIVGSILQFVFVDCLTSGEISLRRTFSRRTGKGVRLFLFNLALGILLVLVIAVLFALLLLPVIAGGMGPAATGGAILVWILLLLVLIIPFALVGMFTVDFVVPVMIGDDCGVIDGWRAVAHLLVAEWQQAAVYVVARVVLGIAAGILVFIAMLLAVLVIAIPFVIIGVVLAAIFQVMNVTLLLLIIPFLLILIPVALLIQVPVVTFFRYYSLQVLGKLETTFALLPEPAVPVETA